VHVLEPDAARRERQRIDLDVDRVLLLSGDVDLV
jgi:hypothetical protein